MLEPSYWIGSKEQKMETTQRVVIGMDPHKRSVKIEVMTADESVLGSRRFGTDIAGFKAMTEFVKQWPTGSGRSRGAAGSAGM